MSFIENLQFYILISVNVYDRISVVLQEGVDTMSYKEDVRMIKACLLYTSPSPRD